MIEPIARYIPQKPMNRSLFLSFVLITLVTGLLIILDFSFSKYLSITYLSVLFPLYISKCLHLIVKSSSYIQKTHPAYYEKHKSVTEAFEGKIVYLPKQEIEKLSDEIVSNHRLKIKQLVILIGLTFLFFIIYSIFITLL